MQSLKEPQPWTENCHSFKQTTYLKGKLARQSNFQITSKTKLRHKLAMKIPDITMIWRVQNLTSCRHDVIRLSNMLPVLRKTNFQSRAPLIKSLTKGKEGELLLLGVFSLPFLFVWVFLCHLILALRVWQGMHLCRYPCTALRFHELHMKLEQQEESTRQVWSCKFNVTLSTNQKVIHSW